MTNNVEGFPPEARRMDDARILFEGAKKHIERGWTQGSQAVDETGTTCIPSSESARAWCPLGAIMAVLPHISKYSSRRRSAFECAWRVLHQVIQKNFQIRTSITAWNDAVGRQQSEVLALLDKAIESLEPNTHGERA